MLPMRKNLIVIPAYNEAAALPQTIARLQELPDSFELAVINDGSTDETGRVAVELAARSRLRMHVLHLPINLGIGVAVQTGYVFAVAQDVHEQSRYEYVVQFDADGQHEAAYVERLVEACRLNAWDICVGSRFLDGSREGFRSTFLRRIGIRFFATLISRLTGATITDPTSGFRCAGPRAWHSFANRYPDDYPEPESLYWCLRNRLRVGEIPVRMHQRQGGVSSIRYWRSAYYMLKVTLAILIDVVRAKERISYER